MRGLFNHVERPFQEERACNLTQVGLKRILKGILYISHGSQSYLFNDLEKKRDDLDHEDRAGQKDNADNDLF